MIKKIKKSSLLIIVVIALFTNMIVAMAMEENPVSANFSSTSVAVGEEIVVTLSTEAFESVAGSITVNFASDKFTLESYSGMSTSSPSSLYLKRTAADEFSSSFLSVSAMTVDNANENELYTTTWADTTNATIEVLETEDFLTLTFTAMEAGATDLSLKVILNQYADDLTLETYTFNETETITITEAAAAAEYYTVNFSNNSDTDVTLTGTTEFTDVTVGSEPSDMPTATKVADGTTTYEFSHWSTSSTEDVEVNWADYVNGETVTVYPVFTEVAAGETNVAYTITTTLDQEKYRSGDTITATFSVSSTTENANIGSFDMGISYDATLMTLKTLTAYGTYNSGATPNVSAGTIGYIHGDDEGTSVSGNGTLFKATFTVLADVSDDETTITVDGGDYDDIKMTPVGYDSNVGTISTVDATAEIIDTVVITLEAESGANGTIGTTTSFTMDSGDSLADVKAMTDYKDPTASTNYVWTGWYNSTGTLLEDTDTFTTDTTITAKFAAGTFTFAGDDANNTGVTITTDDGIEDSKVTYNQDATFTVEAPTDYVLNSVTYEVGENTATATGLTSSNVTATSGTYTIEGANITGNITIVVSVVEYHTVTFQAGTEGSTMTSVTYYAKDGTSNTGLYASLTDMVAGTALAEEDEPTYEISDGYRVADSAWITGTTATTFAAIQSADITEDTTYTVNVVKTYEVEFKANSNGSVAATTTTTYDTGADVTVPTVTPNTGYVFSNWTSTTDNGLDNETGSFTAIEDVTYTANFTEGTYAVSFPDNITGVTFTEKTGLDTNGEATYNQDDAVTFKITTEDVQIDSVKYTVGSGEAQTLMPSTDGVYSIPSSAITGAVSITVTADSLYTVAFTAGESANGTVTGTTSFNVVDKGTLGSDNFANVIVTPNTGYQFDGWYIDTTEYDNPETEEVTANVTYTAKFSQIHYTFTGLDDYDVDFTSGYDDNYATYDTDVTFTISSETDIITGVSLNGTPLAVEDGVYTIPGASISGSDSELELTVSTFTGTMEFIDLDGTYLANVTEAANRKIMVLTVAGDTEGSTTYKLSNEVALWWSEKYVAYVTVVGEGETAATLSVGMTSTATAATEIAYDGDLNGDDAVRSDDAGVVNDILHGKREVTTTDMQMLMADLDGEKYLSTTDVTTVMNTVLSIEAD